MTGAIFKAVECSTPCRRDRLVFDAALSRSKLRELELKSVRGAETVISTGVTAPE